MKKYRIEYEGWNSLKEDLGEDAAFLNCNVFSEDESTEPFPVSVPLSYLKKAYKEMDPEIYRMIERAESRGTKWGIHESETIHELEQCGIDVGSIVIRLIENTLDLEQEENRWAALRSEGIKATEIYEDLQTSASGMKHDADNYYLLCNRIEKALTDEISGLFPVIFNSSSDCIRKFERILRDHIPALAEDVRDLINEAEENMTI